jgi:hypothetical protein
VDPAAKLGGDRLESESAILGTPQVARLVAADADLDIRRRLEPEVGEEADHLVQSVQRHVEPGGELLDLLPREVTAPCLDRTQR